MKKLLVLDLDETLFHAMYPSEYHALLNPRYYDMEICDTYPAFERPHLYKFLDYAFKNFEVGIWTSAGDLYAASAVKLIFTDNGLPEPLFVYSSDRCVRRRAIFNPYLSYYDVDYYYVKDLKKLKKFGFPKEHILAIDDSPEKFERQYGNYIRVTEYYGDENDDELLKLIKYLDTLKDVPNVRTIEKRNWRNSIDLSDE